MFASGVNALWLKVGTEILHLGMNNTCMTKVGYRSYYDGFLCSNGNSLSEQRQLNAIGHFFH